MIIGMYIGNGARTMYTNMWVYHIPYDWNEHTILESLFNGKKKLLVVFEIIQASGIPEYSIFFFSKRRRPLPKENSSSMKIYNKFGFFYS